MEKIEKTRRPRRKLDTRSMTIPEASLSIRVLIDRTSKGLPVNARLSKHIPLPADGELMDDYETGTEEILDVTDAVEYADKIRANMQHIADEKEKARKAALEATDPAPVAPPNNP